MAGLSYDKKMKKWLVRFNWTNPMKKDKNGNFKREHKDYYGHVGETKTQAKARMVRLELEFNDGLIIPGDNVTVNAVYKKWQNANKVRQLALKSLEAYESQMTNRILPFIGHLKIRDVKREHIEEINNRGLVTRHDGKKGLPSSSTAARAFSCVRAFFNYAVEKQYVPFNPCNAVTKPPEAEHEIRIMLEEEIPIFLEKIKVSAYYEALFLAFHTGVRRSEVLALRVRDINVDLLELMVYRAVVVVDGEYHVGRVRKNKKNNQGVRKINLDPTTGIFMRHYLERKQEHRRVNGLPLLSPDDLLFSKADGYFINPDVFSEDFRKAIKGTTLVGLKLHELRHTHASWLLELTGNPKVVQERLGHHSPSFTLSTYIKKRDEQDKVGAEQFSRMVQGFAAKHAEQQAVEEVSESGD